MRPSSVAAGAPSDVAYPDVNYGQSDDVSVPAVGNYTRIMSQAQLHRDFQEMDQLSAHDAGKAVWIRARVQNIRAKGNSCFIVLRQGPFSTMQACYFKDKSDPDRSKAMLKFMAGITSESVVDIQVCTRL